MGKSESALMKLFSKKPTTHSNFLFLNMCVTYRCDVSLFIILGKFRNLRTLRHHEHEICPTVSFSFQRSADFHFEMWREGGKVWDSKYMGVAIVSPFECLSTDFISSTRCMTHKSNVTAEATLFVVVMWRFVYSTSKRSGYELRLYEIIVTARWIGNAMKQHNFDWASISWPSTRSAACVALIVNLNSTSHERVVTNMKLSKHGSNSSSSTKMVVREEQEEFRNPQRNVRHSTFIRDV